MRFTEEQIRLIEDKVINKLVAPMYYLAKLRRQTTDSMCEMALSSLNELVAWVRSLRDEKVD